MRAFKIYFLSNFQIYIINYSHHAVHYIPRTLLYFEHLHSFHPSSNSGDHQFILVCMSLFFVFFLDSTYKWNHAIFVFPIWFILLSIISSTSIHIFTNDKNSFLGLNKYFLHIYIYTAYYIFFICSFVDGHLGCLHILAIVNNAAINIACRYLFWVF